ncbi:protein of unknown function [Magnetospirillum sp. XM-1]|uniref:XRE family transcriptional regulator n=1 Tax=Magnetospirillum sp. XM-1 TaxID=1663591 RepID=UPI00073E0D3A|nr:XRE family transcriptional regulator [Magnetospirillum sp. XM-1]CUW40069.1 protein of unknown function [Magnetospirillum sp. XM-1]
MASKNLDVGEVVKTAFLEAGRDETVAVEEAIKAEAIMWLSEQIKDSGLTQSQFGDKIGWSQSTVSALLRGNLEDYSVARVNKALAVFGAKIEMNPKLVKPKKARTNILGAMRGQIRIAPDFDDPG